jgi:serine protease inhibitor
MKPLIAFLLVIILTVTTACGAELTKPKPNPNPEQKKDGDGAMISKEQSTDVVNSRMNFAFSLYPQVIQEQVNKNIFISPVSIMLALMMAYNGADGETQAAMETTLESTGISLEALNRANQSWIQSLEKSDENVHLQIANSLWGREGISFEDAFVDNVKDYYNAEVQSLDFDQPEASDTINQWVSDQTNDKIKQIVGKPINSDTILFLINAIYFNGKWERPFDQKLTGDDTFHLTDSVTKQHSFMNRSGNFKYLQEDTFQAIQLPYGDGATSMYAFLPDESSSLQSFQEQLTSDNWSTWLSSFQDRKGAVALPKFKLEYELELKNALTAMGMGIAFEEGSTDFTKMVVDKASEPFISSVKHKTYIDVHEEGTEAAAVTSIEVSTTSLNTSEPEPFEMKMNRPFFIVITDNQTGTILFMGSIYDPQL